jgi:hypothetical protein
MSDKWMLIEMILPLGCPFLYEAFVTRTGAYLLRRFPISDRARWFGCMQFSSLDRLADHLARHWVSGTGPDYAPVPKLRPV